MNMVASGDKNMKNLSETVDVINGFLKMFNETLPIVINLKASINQQYNELENKYLEIYFKIVPKNKKAFEKTGLLNDLGYNYLQSIKNKILIKD